MRFLLSHPTEGIIASAGTVEGIGRAKKILVSEMEPGYPHAGDFWVIVGPLSGDPDDPTIPERFDR